MSDGGPEPDDQPHRVVWQARPSARTVMAELAFAVLLSAAFVVVVVVLPRSDPWNAWFAVVLPALSVARSIATALRGRVVLSREGIEVRRVLTRHYPWASLRSLTLEDDGRIEITPNGWVRTLPIPPDEAPEAFAIMTSHRAAARAGS